MSAPAVACCFRCPRMGLSFSPVHGGCSSSWPGPWPAGPLCSASSRDGTSRGAELPPGHVVPSDRGLPVHPARRRGRGIHRNLRISSTLRARSVLAAAAPATPRRARRVCLPRLRMRLRPSGTAAHPQGVVPACRHHLHASGAPILNPIVLWSTAVAYRGSSMVRMVVGRGLLGFLVAVAVGWVVGRQIDPKALSGADPSRADRDCQDGSHCVHTEHHVSDTPRLGRFMGQVSADFLI